MNRVSRFRFPPQMGSVAEPESWSDGTASLASVMAHGGPGGVAGTPLLHGGRQKRPADTPHLPPPTRSVHVWHDGKVTARGNVEGDAWRRFLRAEFPAGAFVTVRDSDGTHATYWRRDRIQGGYRARALQRSW